MQDAQKKLDKLRRELKAKLWKGAYLKIAEELKENGHSHISINVCRNYFSDRAVKLNDALLIVNATKKVIDDRAKAILEAIDAKL